MKMHGKVNVAEPPKTLAQITEEMETISLRMAQINDFVSVLEKAVCSELEELDGTEEIIVKTIDRLASLTALLKIALDKNCEDTNKLINECMALERGGAIA